MKLPPRVAIEALTDFCICFFKDNRHAPAARPHFYIVIPVNDTRDLVLCLVTSQVEKRLRYYHNRDNHESSACLVRATSEDLPCLSKESLADCNQVEFLSKRELIQYIDPGHEFTIVQSPVSHEFKEKILRAITNSPTVKGYIKKLLASLSV